RLLGRKSHEEIHRTCADALAKLPHDHTARFLANALADALIRLDDLAGLREVLLKHRALFSGALRKDEFFPRRRNYLLDRIPALVALAEKNDSAALRRDCRKLRWRSRMTLLPAFWPEN